MNHVLTRHGGALADAVLAAHVSVAAFAAAGLFLIIFGGLAGAPLVRNLRFRAVHLGLMLFIAGETALGQMCLLTRLEQALRLSAGQPAYTESFIEHWLTRMIFFESPPWVFVVLHCFAALVVAITWFLVPPHWPGTANEPLKAPDAVQR